MNIIFTPIRFTLLYFLLLVIVIFSDINFGDYGILFYCTKPLLILSLSIYFWSQSVNFNSSSRMLIMGALLCSCIGDTLLMFNRHYPLFFIFSLVAFLLAHIFYVFSFLKHYDGDRNPIGFLAFLLIYTLGLYFYIYDGLGNLFAPVTVYVAIILALANVAYMRDIRLSKSGYYLVCIGTFLFICSDSLIALNKFYHPILYPKISVLLIYATGQFLIVKGLLKTHTDTIVTETKDILP